MPWESARSQLFDKVARISDHSFEDTALAVFQYQAEYNELYATYLKLIRKSINEVEKLDDIPFLPIQFFKRYEIKTGSWQATTIFTSSGTSGSQTSQHFVYDPKIYLENTYKSFKEAYGKVEDYCWLALLPAYLERKGSSLIVMTQYFIEQSKYSHSGFYLNEYQELIEKLQFCKKNNIPTILLGVSFALWDLAEQFPLDLQDITIMETGGMKGRRPEITRKALHQILTSAFNVNKIHSEYGMTELYSQAYSKGDGIFYPAPTMKVSTREVTDPFSPQKLGKTGGINIIDLANLDTISFIATDDVGKVFEDGSFSILGRLDASDVRGCNLMVEG